MSTRSTPTLPHPDRDLRDRPVLAQLNYAAQFKLSGVTALPEGRPSTSIVVRPQVGRRRSPLTDGSHCFDRILRLPCSSVGVPTRPRVALPALRISGDRGGGDVGHCVSACGTGDKSLYA